MTTLCNHCGFDIAIRNPSGYCDHLYYPECCDVCNGKKKPESALQQSINELSANIDKNIELLAKQRDEIIALRSTLKNCREMTDELSRTMDEDHWYFDDLKNLKNEINETLNKGTL